MKLYDLNLLTALDALLSTHSVTRAAERMHLSTPAMSHILAKIRETVGDPILVRAGRKLVPTPRALELVEPVRQLLTQAQALLAQSAGLNLASVTRTFVVRAPEGIAVVYGAPLSLALQEVMPGASLQFLPQSHNDATGLRDGRIALDIGALAEQDPEITVELISEQSLVGVVKAGHPLLHGKLTAKRFAAERHIALNRQPREPSPLDDALAKMGLQRFVALTVPSAYAALVIAGRSQLVATATERVARAMQAGMGLQVFELPVSLPKVPMALAWHPRYHVEPAHTWLRECFKRVLGDPNWHAPPVEWLNTPSGKVRLHA